MRASASGTDQAFAARTLNGRCYNKQTLAWSAHPGSYADKAVVGSPFALSHATLLGGPRSGVTDWQDFSRLHQNVALAGPGCRAHRCLPDAQVQSIGYFDHLGFGI